MPQSNPRRQKRGSGYGEVHMGGMRPQGPRRRSDTGLFKAWAVRVGVVVLVILVLALGLVGLSNTSLFAIREVSVTGVSHLTVGEMTELAAVPSNTTLLRVDTASIEERLRSNPWVERVAVHRRLPSTLELSITERTIAAVVEVPRPDSEATDDWAIASDGTWLMMIPPQGTEEASSVSASVYEDAENVLHIVDVPYGADPVVGATCTDAGVSNALAVVSGLSEDLAWQVSTVSATDTTNAVLNLRSGIEIAFGTDEDIRDKERVCLKLMEDHAGQISYINVRVVDRPTWRSLTQ